MDLRPTNAHRFLVDDRPVPTTFVANCLMTSDDMCRWVLAHHLSASFLIRKRLTSCVPMNSVNAGGMAWRTS